MLEQGRTLDRYTVEALLGSGGMADVYRVRHTTLGSPHALKVLRVQGGTIRDRLVQEGRVQASLRHPNIVAVTDVIDVEGAPGLVMEFVEGPTLEGWLQDHRPPWAQAERIFRGVLAAVARAHQAGLVHRDLKPANVLLVPGDDGLVPKVADFGLAKVLNDEEGASIGKTRSGIAMGTPQYMAPEQIRDSRSVDARADIFALGCILYELLAGRPPFEAEDVLAVFNAVTAGRYAPVDAPPHLQRAIAGCIVVDRDARIPDVATLRKVLDGEPWITSARSTRDTMAGSFYGLEAAYAGGAPPAAAVVATAVPALATAAPSPAPVLAQPHPAASRSLADSASTMLPLDDELELEPAPAPRSRRLALLAGALVVVVAGGGFLLATGGLLAWHFTGQADPPEAVVAPEVTEAVVAKDAPVAAADTPPLPTETTPVRTSTPPPAARPKAEARSAGAEAPPATAATPGPVAASDAVLAAEQRKPTAVTPAEAATSTKAATGTVTVAGDPAQVRLVRDGVRHRPGALPPGDYAVEVTFPGLEPVPSPPITLRDGETVTLRCRASFQRCQP